MSAIWTGSHGWTIERGDYGWVVYQQAKTAKGGDCTKRQSYHATIEQACERVARHVANDEARTLRQYADSIRATMAEFSRLGVRTPSVAGPVAPEHPPAPANAQKRRGSGHAPHASTGS